MGCARRPARVFLTGSFWCSAVAMAAAVATLTELERRHVVERLEALGLLLRQGWRSEAPGWACANPARRPCPCCCSTTTPISPAEEPFCAAALRAGAYLHPRHNMFLCAAHDEADVAAVLGAAEAGFAAIRRMGDRR
jgi:glutamate-1-semialdehyde 2,1-aminomutase